MLGNLIDVYEGEEKSTFEDRKERIAKRSEVDAPDTIILILINTPFPFQYGKL